MTEPSNYPSNLLNSLVPLVTRNLEIEISGDDYVLSRNGPVRQTRINASMAYFLGLCTGEKTLGELLEELSRQSAIPVVQLFREITPSLAQLGRTGFVVFCGVPCFGDQPPGPHYAPNTYRTDRGRIVRRVLESRGYRPATPDQIAEIALCTHKMKGNRHAKYRDYTPAITIELRSKRKLCQNLRESLSEHLAPTTFISLEEFHNRTADSPTDTWFVKLSGSTEGKGVFVEKGAKNVQRRVESFGNESFVIQENVTDLHLLEQRKACCRVFVLALSGPRYYLYNRSLFYRFPEKFVADKPTRHSQIFGEIYEGNIIKYCDSDNLDFFQSALPDLKQNVTKLFHGVSHHFESISDPYRYHLFGLDYLFTRQLQPVLIEVNDWPMITDLDHHPEWMRQSRHELIDEMFDLVLSNGDARKLNRFEPLQQSNTRNQ